MQHLKFSYADAYKLPVWKRIWFIGKLKEEIENSKQNNNNVPVTNNNKNNIFKKSF